MCNYYRTVLYIGVTANVEWRVLAHKKGMGSEFTTKYNTIYLVYYERYPMIEQAIWREKQLKNWHREWKFNLIKVLNPDLVDLADDWYCEEDLIRNDQ